MAYVLEHAEITLVVAENQEQVDKVASIADRVPTLRHMVYDEPRGLRDYDRAKLSWIDLTCSGVIATRSCSQFRLQPFSDSSYQSC